MQLLGSSSNRFAPFFLMGLLAIGFFGGCHQTPSNTPPIIPIDTLRIAAVDSMLSPQVLQKFTATHGIYVKLTEYKPQELFKMISSSNAKQFNIFFAPHYMTDVLKDSVGIAPVGDFYKKKKTNKVQYFEDRHDSLSAFSLPYYFSFMGILANWQHVGEILDLSWEDIFMRADSLKEKNSIIVKINNYSFYHLLKPYQPDSSRNMALNDASLTTFIKEKAFYTQIENTNYHDIYSDTLLSAIVWSYQAERAISEDRKLLFLVPGKYVLIQTYDFHVNSNVTDTTTIHNFLRYITRPQIVAENTNYSHAANLFEDSWSFVSYSIFRGPSYDYPTVQPNVRHLPLMEYPSKSMFKLPADLLHK